MRGGGNRSVRGVIIEKPVAEETAAPVHNENEEEVFRYNRFVLIATFNGDFIKGFE